MVWPCPGCAAVTGIVLHSAVPKSQVVLSGRAVKKQTLVVARTINAKYQKDVDYMQADCAPKLGHNLAADTDPGGAGPVVSPECQIQRAVRAVIEEHRSATREASLIKSHEVGWSKLWPVDIRLRKQQTWSGVASQESEWRLERLLFPTLYYLLSVMESHTQTEGAAAGDCFAGPPRRSDTGLWTALPEDRKGVDDLFNSWTSIIHEGKCDQDVDGKVVGLSAQQFMQAFSFAIVGLRINKASHSMKIHPSWDLLAGESISITNVNFHEHRLSVRIDADYIEISRQDRLTEPLYVVPKRGPSLTLYEGQHLTHEAGVLYLSYDETKAHLLRHEDPEDHPAPQAAHNSWPGWMIVGLVLAVIAFHIILFAFLWREFGSDSPGLPLPNIAKSFQKHGVLKRKVSSMPGTHAGSVTKVRDRS